VDIYNQIAWIDLVQKQEKPLNMDIDKINRDTKTIRKIQMESKILYLLQETTDSSLQLEGQILQIEETRTLVYFPEYKCMFSCNTTSNPEWKPYQKVECKIYIFERETDYRKKIKMEIL
jgi:hypothetical protein